jgi:hypothetical protein
MELVAAANKEELLEMITHGAQKIINSNEEFVFILSSFCSISESRAECSL